MRYAVSENEIINVKQLKEKYFLLFFVVKYKGEWNETHWRYNKITNTFRT